MGMCCITMTNFTTSTNDQFHIQFRSNEGYGDFITGLSYAHSSVIKYQRPVKITFHWPNPKDHLLSNIDKESILYRFNHVLEWMKPVDGLTIAHRFSSVPSWRFINELEEFNLVHGLWYQSKKLPTKQKLVVHWSSKHNLTFPGYEKDPLYDHWDDIVDHLKSVGYDVVEVTYRTPIKQALELMAQCQFGIGYEGMIHQLFKIIWKPTIIASQRVRLTRLLCPHSHIVNSYEDFAKQDLHDMISSSERLIDKFGVQLKQYINDKQDPTTHPLYNMEIGK